MNALDAAARLAGRPGRVLLHSASDADGLGRASFAAADPVEVVTGGAGALDRLEALARDHIVIGWLGYEAGRRLVGLPPRDDDAEMWFGAYRAVYRYDERTGAGTIIGPDPAPLDAILASSFSSSSSISSSITLHPEDPGDLAYRLGFDRVKAYLAAGDCYQVNLARRLVADVDHLDPLEVYRRIAQVSPAPCGAVIEGDGLSVVSSSPERFLARDAGSDRLETRPIKGTRRRGAAADELASDEKERAEHLMIVDLERNDLGRVADTGTVAVDSFARVVELPTVLHLVSTVSCRTRAGAADVLRATFPGGSITGAPKRRAMEIIDELEPFRRGVYTGAIGYLAPGGALDLAIAIRTAVLSPRRLTIAVGGGVVADSRLERELEETEEKVAAWRAALAPPTRR